MQINSNTNIDQAYQKTLYSEENKTSSQSFKDELAKQTSSNSLQITSAIQKADEVQEREHEVLTYENTKGMTDQEVDKYFSQRTKEERDTIKYLIQVSNNFSEDDTANEVVFQEAMLKDSFSDQEKFLFKMNVELFVEGVDKPSIHLNSEWFHAKDNSIANPEKQGIYVTPDSQYNYEYRETKPSQKFSTEEASRYFSDMAKITKAWMEKMEGFSIYDYYKKDYEMYQRMSENYNTLLS